MGGIHLVRNPPTPPAHGTQPATTTALARRSSIPPADAKSMRPGTLFTTSK